VLINRKRFDQSKIGFQQRNPGFNKENWGWVIPNGDKHYFIWWEDC
jgi:hypothetical protein